MQVGFTKEAAGAKLASMSHRRSKKEHHRIEKYMYTTLFSCLKIYIHNGLQEEIIVFSSTSRLY